MPMSGIPTKCKEVIMHYYHEAILDQIIYNKLPHYNFVLTNTSNKGLL